MRKFVLVLTLASLLVLTVTGTAFAAKANHMFNFDGSKAQSDRTMEITASNCNECHAGSLGHMAGPHGGYASTTDKCQACHDVHGKGENAALLMGVTVTAACQYCHDLTATWAGPYNMNGLASVGSAHRVVGIDVYSYIDSEGHANEPTTGVTIIPGGNGADGSEGVINNYKNLYTGKDPILSGQVFTCNSCHTPHGVKTVKPYLGESFVKYYNVKTDEYRLYMTTRLLKQRPNYATDDVRAAVYDYTSNWCLGCHSGRDDKLTQTEIHNHPVNENQTGYQLMQLAGVPDAQITNIIAKLTDDADGDGRAHNPWAATPTFDVDDCANDYVSWGTASTDPLKLTADPRTNKQFAMTPGDFMGDWTVNGSGVAIKQDVNESRNTYGDGFDPINVKNSDGTYKYVDKGPACQQCHGSARNVEAKWAWNFDSVSGNPAKASFPHISKNKALLVETADDFCTNCHDPNVLP